MKQLFVSVYLLAACITIHAQSKKQSGGISFGARAGINFQNINGRDFNDNKLENKLVPRFHAGLNAELPLADEFFVQPGVLFATKGTKFKGSNTVLNLSYIEVPVNLVFKPTLGSGKLLLGLGPYVGFGIGGKLKPTNGNDVTVDFRNKVNIFEYATFSYYRSLDAGANLLFGYELSSKLSVQLNAQLGLVNINPDIDGVNSDKTAFKNTGFGISLGYRFN